MKITIFDLETSGIEQDSAIVQFAAIQLDLEKNKEIDTLSFTCKPDKPISKGASEVHGITNEMVQDLPLFKSFISKVKKIFKGSEVIAGYNVCKFDAPVLDNQLMRIDESKLCEGKYLYDCYLVYLQHHRRKLADSVAFYLNEKFENGAHDALNDVKMTTRVLKAQLAKEGKNIKEIKQKDNPLDKYFKIENGKHYWQLGKHKGKSLDEIDKGYLIWIGKSDFSVDVKEVVAKYL